MLWCAGIVLIGGLIPFSSTVWRNTKLETATIWCPLFSKWRPFWDNTSWLGIMWAAWLYQSQNKCWYLAGWHWIKVEVKVLLGVLLIKGWGEYGQKQCASFHLQPPVLDGSGSSAWVDDALKMPIGQTIFNDIEMLREILGRGGSVGPRRNVVLLMVQ